MKRRYQKSSGKKDAMLKRDEEVIREQSKTVRSQQSAIQHLKKMLQSEELDMSPAQMLQYGDMLSNKGHQGIDIPYLRTVLFPELYTADIPQPMSCQSYAKFTDKKEITISTGASGEGVMLWFPYVNTGPSLFVTSTATATAALPLALSDAQWLRGFHQDYTPYYSQTCLVSASLSIQYVGQIQTEQGFFVASNISGINTNALTIDDIENGTNRILARPGEGIRLVQLPTDLNDFVFYPAQSTTPTSTLLGPPAFQARNQAGAQIGSSVTSVPITQTSTTWLAGQVGTQVKAWPTGGNQSIQYSEGSDYYAIYWKGLAATQNVIRIDMCRRFNGTPQSSIRDYVDVSRPKKSFDPKKTIDVINDLQVSVPQLAGHTLKSMDRVSDQIQAHLPNIGHLYNSGQLKESMTLGALGQQLSLQQSGVTGMPTFAGRIWDDE